MAKKNALEFDTLTNKYTVVSKRGQGGVGTVFEVSDLEGDSYALKFFSSSVPTSEKLKRFRNEMEFLRRTNHQNVVSVSDYGYVSSDDRKLPFYVMPLFNGTLRTVMKEKIPVANCVKYFGQILDGVEVLHLKNVWHRDLKPENILFDEEADRFVVADLGVAHFGEDELHTAVETKPSSRLANFRYAAPEQRHIGGVVNQAADFFALGLILNEMFTGDVIQGIGHRTVADVAPDYSYLDELIGNMVQQSPDKRPNTIDSIKRQLIARKNDFIKLQKISELEKTVVPTSELTDPIKDDPIRIVGVDYEHGNLIFHLNRHVNEAWVNNFKSPQGGISYPWGKEPRNYNVRGNTLSIDSSEQDAPRIADFLKTYLPRVHIQYIYSQEQKLKAEEQRQRTALQERIDREKKQSEVKQRVLDSLKF